jgi:hypothetical protein
MGARGIGDQPPDERRGVVVMNRTIGRWRAFAQSHRARYRARRRARGLLALTLRRPAAAAVHNEHRHRVTLTWAPRLNLHVRWPVVSRIQVLRGVRRRSGEAARSTPQTRAVGESPAVARIHRSGEPVRPNTQRPGGDLPTSFLLKRPLAQLQSPLERVFARSSRFEAAAVGVARGIVRLPARMTLRAGRRIETGPPGVGRVLHRSSHQEAAEPQRGAGSRTAMLSEAPATHRSPDAGLMSESSLNSLTDRVIRQLDRRIVAYRERLGRPA